MSYPSIPIFGTAAALIAYFLIKKPAYKIIDLRGTFEPAGRGWPYRPIEDITDATVHHSAGGTEETVQSISRYHVVNKDWNGIGYHVVINPDKREIYLTNDPTALSWHNGTNNRNALGICVMGNKGIQPVDDWTTGAIVWTVKYMKRKYNMKNLYRLVGHGEYRGHTSCPGSLMPMDEMRSMLKMAGSSSTQLALLSGFMPDADGYNPGRADH